MVSLRLAKLPERVPVKLALSISPELHAALTDYQRLYAEQYGVEESLVELAPAMLAAFLESDREFAKRRRTG